MLTGKTALITGGSRGIGAAIARKFASMGANIAIVYAGNQEAAQSVCGQCEGFGVKAAAYQCNVADFEEVKDFCNARLAEYKWVRLIEFVSEMPKTISGKIRKTELRAAT